ncbi:MAG: hypothetical protein LBE14_04480 [Treponema sp.]|jgi:hypothetical protein|nr:hypothetical protein [Treponema sp.]
MGSFRPVFFLLAVLLIPPGLSPPWAQAAVLPADPAALIGLSLENLLSRFGAPRMVYAARGNEEWQDDVVFTYEEADFYVYKDRVWQIGLKAAYGIRLGDPRPAVILTLGEEAEDFEDHILLALPSKGWPLAFRVNVNESGFVSALFVYRSDF